MKTPVDGRTKEATEGQVMKTPVEGQAKEATEGQTRREDVT